MSSLVLLLLLCHVSYSYQIKLWFASEEPPIHTHTLNCRRHNHQEHFAGQYLVQGYFGMQTQGASHKVLESLHIPLTLCWLISTKQILQVFQQLTCMLWTPSSIIWKVFTRFRSGLNTDWMLGYFEAWHLILWEDSEWKATEMKENDYHFELWVGRSV